MLVSAKIKDSGVTEREVFQVIRENYDKLFSAEKKVADYILSNPQSSINLNVSELAKRSGVSDATVVRMCHRLGYTGYYQFRIVLAQYLGKNQYESKALRDAKAAQKNKDAVEKLFVVYAKKLIGIGKRIDAKVMLQCADLVRNCNHAHILAVGNTCPLAQYMGFRLGRLGVRCTYNIAPEYFFNHVNLAEEGDIIIAISQSGTSKQIIQCVELGTEKGLKVIAITAYEQSPLSELADFVLLSSGDAETDGFDFYKYYAHLNETAVIDALLDFVTNEVDIKTKQADILELILSEYKI